MDNDPVPVQSDGHHCQRGHEHGHAGERLDKLAQQDVVRHAPGHVDPVHHSPGYRGGYQQIRYGQVEHEDVTSCSVGLSPRTVVDVNLLFLIV